jgi:hypothetical protein
LWSNCADFVLLAALGLTHLLRNPTNLPLISEDQWDAIVMLQHHPDCRVRDIWAFVLPHFSKAPFNPPKLQTMIRLKQIWQVDQKI